MNPTTSLPIYEPGTTPELPSLGSHSTPPNPKTESISWISRNNPAAFSGEKNLESDCWNLSLGAPEDDKEKRERRKDAPTVLQASVWNAAVVAALHSIFTSNEQRAPLKLFLEGHFALALTIWLASAPLLRPCGLWHAGMIQSWFAPCWVWQTGGGLISLLNWDCDFIIKNTASAGPIIVTAVQTAGAPPSFHCLPTHEFVSAQQSERMLCAHTAGQERRKWST